MWNGFTVLGKRQELLEGTLETLLQAEKQLQKAPGNLLVSGEIQNRGGVGNIKHSQVH